MPCLFCKWFGNFERAKDWLLYLTLYNMHWEDGSFHHIWEEKIHTWCMGGSRVGKLPPLKPTKGFLFTMIFTIRKQHLQSKTILPSTVLSQQCCGVYFIPLTVKKPLWDLTTKYYWSRAPLTCWLDPPWLYVIIIPLSHFNFSNELILDANLPFQNWSLLRSWWVLINFAYKIYIYVKWNKLFLKVFLGHSAGIRLPDLPRDLVRSSSGQQQLSQTTKKATWFEIYTHVKCSN